MTILSDVRKKYPQYNDLSDQELADKYHSKYYADMPKEEYYSKIGISGQPQSQPQKQSSILEDFASNAVGAIPELAQGVMQLPSELYGAATHPIRTLKNIPIGIGEGASGLWNLPVNAAQYLSEKGYLPEAVSKYAPYAHIPVQEIEKKLGIEAKEPGEALTRMLSGFGLWGKLGKFGEASKLKRAGLGAGYAGGQEENPVAGAITALVPNMIKGGVKGWEYLKEPSKAITDTEGTLAHIKDLLSEHKEHGKTQESGMSQFINQIQEGLSNKQNQFKAELPEIFPIKPLAETRKNLSTATNESIKNLANDFDDRYAKFNTDFGNAPINEPFEYKNINLNGLQNVSHTTKNMAYGVSNDELSYTDHNGDTYHIKFPSDNSSVKDYVDFSRELRDAAWDSSKASKNATHGEKIQLRKTSLALRQLQDEAEQKIKDTIGPDAFNHFKQIQTDYSQLMGPVKTEPSLYNAAYKKKINSTIHNTLLQPANEHIRNYLYQSPEFTNALREHLMQGPSHPLTKGAQLNPAAINQDLHYLLTNEQKSALNETNNLALGQKHLDQISKNIKQPELLTARQEQNIRQFHPDMNQYLNNLIEGKETKASLENEQKMLESQIEELKRKRTRRKLAIGAAAGLGSIALGGSTISKIIRKIL